MVLGKAVLLGAAGLFALHKVRKHFSEHLKRAEEDYEHIPLRSLMSMLVHCVYFRDTFWWEDVLAWLSEYSNARAWDYGHLHWIWNPYQVDELDLKELGLAFFIRKPSHRNLNAPELAIVLRGTILTKSSDLLADLRIGLELLHHSDRVLRTVKLIVQVVEEFRCKYPRGRICMAGHSLGAAIALLVGGCMYSIHHIYIDTHLFNPPLLTLVDFVTGRAFPRATAPATFYGDDDVSELKVDFARLRELFVQHFGNRAAVDAELAHFWNLQDWVPNFYLNPGDLFCHRYIHFYNQTVERPGDVMSSQGLISGLFYRQASSLKNVVPSADLHISNWKRGNLRLAHSLRQWHKYTPEYIELEPVRHVRLLQLPPEPLRRPRDRRY